MRGPQHQQIAQDCGDFQVANYVDRMLQEQARSAEI